MAAITTLVQKMFDVGCSPTPMGHLEIKDKTISKGLAKKLWGIGDVQLEALPSTKEGRSVVYKLVQVIEASLSMPVKSGVLNRHAILLQKFHKMVQDSHVTCTGFKETTITHEPQNDQLQQLADYYQLQLNAYNSAKTAHVAFQMKETLKMNLEQAKKELDKAHTNLILQQRRGQTLRFLAVPCSENNFEFALPSPDACDLD